MRDWALKASCRSANGFLFFGDADESRSERIARESEAKKICVTCFVSNECLDDAITNSIEYGIWGGMTASERRRLIYQDSSDSIPRRVPLALETIEDSVIVESRISESGRTVFLRMLPTDETWHGCKWLVCVDQEIKYHAYDEADAWLFFGTLVFG